MNTIPFRNSPRFNLQNTFINIDENVLRTHNGGRPNEVPALVVPVITRSQSMDALDGDRVSFGISAAVVLETGQFSFDMPEEDEVSSLRLQRRFFYLFSSLPFQDSGLEPQIGLLSSQIKFSFCKKVHEKFLHWN